MAKASPQSMHRKDVVLSVAKLSAYAREVLKEILAGVLVDAETPRWEALLASVSCCSVRHVNAAAQRGIDTRKSYQRQAFVRT